MKLDPKFEKLLIIIRVILLVVLFFPFGIIAMLFEDGIFVNSDNIISFIHNHNIDYIVCFGSLVAGIIITAILGDDMPISPNKFKHSKKYKFKYNDAGELNEDIKSKLKEYSCYKEYSISNEEKMYLYFKRENDRLIKIWLIADLVTFNNHKRKKMQEYLEQFAEEMYGNEKTNDRMEYFLLICVKKYTPLFETTIRSNYDNWSRDLGLPVGIVFENKRMYIPSTKELKLIDKEKYEYMNEEFFKVVEVTPLRKTKV